MSEVKEKSKLWLRRTLVQRPSHGREVVDLNETIQQDKADSEYTMKIA